MAKIFDFRSGKVRPGTDSGAQDIRNDVNHSARKRPIDKETYMLWMFSKDIDQVLNRYIIEHKLKAPELAAILSHRLGGLVATTEQPEKLGEFCESVMRRMALVEESGSKGESASGPSPSGTPGDDKGAS